MSMLSTCHLTSPPTIVHSLLSHPTTPHPSSAARASSFPIDFNYPFTSYSPPNCSTSLTSHPNPDHSASLLGHPTPPHLHCIPPINFPTHSRSQHIPSNNIIHHSQCIQPWLPHNFPSHFRYSAYSTSLPRNLNKPPTLTVPFSTFYCPPMPERQL